MDSEPRKYKTVVGMRTESGASYGLATVESVPEELTYRELTNRKSYFRTVMSQRSESVLHIDGESGSQVFINPEHIAYISIYPVEND